MEHSSRTPGFRAPHPRCVVLTVACLVLLICSAAAFARSPTPTSSHSESSPKVARFYLAGTNGYKVSVFASVEGPQSPIDVVVENFKGGAEYQTQGLVTANRIHASYGQLGAISLRFHPSGRISHSRIIFGNKGCPRGAKARLGVFQGIFRFRGENRYTSVDAHRISGGVGDPTAPIDHKEELSLGCPQRLRLIGLLAQASTQPLKEAGGATLRAISTGPTGSVMFAAAPVVSKSESGSATKTDSYFFVALTEEQLEQTKIARAVFQAGPASTDFVLNNALGSATVSPPAPFSGSGSFQRNADGSISWTGSLSVPMHGRGLVALTGPAFKAELSKP